MSFLHSKNNYELLKNIKKFTYQGSSQYANMKSKTTWWQKQANIFILGHSCGASDLQILGDL
jgi:hypothetical protein